MKNLHFIYNKMVQKIMLNVENWENGTSLVQEKLKFCSHMNSSFANDNN